jgi:hypothetical protein
MPSFDETLIVATAFHRASIDCAKNRAMGCSPHSARNDAHVGIANLRRFLLAVNGVLNGTANRANAELTLIYFPSTLSRMAKKISGVKLSSGSGGAMVGGASVLASRSLRTATFRSTARGDARPTGRMKSSIIPDGDPAALARLGRGLIRW